MASLICDLVDRQTPPVLAGEHGDSADWGLLLAGTNGRKSVLEFGENRNIFRQGDRADSVFYLQRGKVKLTVTSQQGKEAIVALLAAGEFFGEGCLAGQLLRMETATTVSDCTLVRIERSMIARMLHEQLGVSELFVKHLLSRNIRLEEDLVDQLLNNSEKRLARILLLLSHLGKESTTDTVVAGINQENLAQMVGTTRSRVSHFMNQFRNCGCVDYDKCGELIVHDGLISVVMNGTCTPMKAEVTPSRKNHWPHANKHNPASMAKHRG